MADTASAQSGKASPSTLRRDTLREMFAYNDWARDQLLALAAGLPDELLDRTFEMGSGSLRATLHHLWAAERIWLDRWQALPKPVFVQPEAGLPIEQLGQRFRDTAAQRNEWLMQRSDPDLHEKFSYTNMRGEHNTFQYGDMLMHVCNHGAHHRAQALNMLRHAGVKPPWLDYLAFKLAQPAEPPPPRLQMRTLRDYYAYGDWAMLRTLDAAAGLSDEPLDRPFELGLGTLRRTLLHIRYAEQWWLENWTRGPDNPFPELPANTPVGEIRRLFDQTAAERDAFISKQNEADLLRMVTARPRPGVERRFPLGCVMLQLCHHGTHHRAQALNMLRHLGVTPPPLDFLIRLR